MFRILVASLLLIATPTTAQPSAPSIQQQPARHFVVLNKPGPAWEELKDHRAAAIAHRQLYLDLASRGDIVVGGRIDGLADEPPFGMSIFRSGIDREEVRKLLDGDELVKAGVITLEFREWSIQMGSLREDKQDSS